MYENMGKNRNKIKKAIWIAVPIIMIIIWGIHVAAGMWVYNKVEDSGGLKETLVDVVKTVKQIDKESDVK